jgi:hypothetical protein
MCDFFAAISASWWWANFPPQTVQQHYARTRAYFKRHKLDTITDDVIVVWARKAQ